MQVPFTPAFSQWAPPYICLLLSQPVEIWLRDQEFFFLSLSSFSLVITTLLGWMPTWTVVLLAFSHCLLAFSCCTAQCRWLFLSVYLDYLANLLTFVVSSNHLDLVILQMGMECTLYFCCSSLESREDMIFLHTCEGALKWHLWFLLRLRSGRSWTSWWPSTPRLWAQNAHINI
jgi:hypothetical protein